jgi:Bacterial SH3 domain
MYNRDEKVLGQVGKRFTADLARPYGRVPTFTKMALIRCYECGKEISSLATACPSCGAPPRSTIVPPPLPTEARPASRAKQLSWGTIALLTGVVLVLVIRGMTFQPNTPSVAASPTPATAESAKRISRPIETGSLSPTTPQIPTAESAMRTSPPIETASQGSSSPTATEIPIADLATRSSPPIETAPESSPSPIAAETPYASDVSLATATPHQATYQVIGIPQGDYLNVREGAGSDYQVVTKLEPGMGGILLGTKRVANGATMWQEITVHGQTGWVNAAYIALESQAPTSPAETSTAP